MTTIEIILAVSGGGLLLCAIKFVFKLGSYAKNFEYVKTTVGNIESDCKDIWKYVHNHDKDISSLKGSVFGDQGSPMKVNDREKNF